MPQSLSDYNPSSIARRQQSRQGGSTLEILLRMGRKVDGDVGFLECSTHDESSLGQCILDITHKRRRVGKLPRFIYI